MIRYSKEQIIETLKNLAERLQQNSLSTKDIASVISVSTVAGKFGNIGNALEAAGLERKGLGDNFRGRGRQIEDGNLFQALHAIEKMLATSQLAMTVPPIANTL
jgi:hypothetical protein